MATPWVLPELPNGLRWKTDVHRNAFAGEVVSLKIIKRQRVNIMGVKLPYNQEVAHVVTYDEPGWVQDEIDRMSQKVRG